MIDPFTAATGAVGIVGFALQSAQQLSTAIDGVAEAPANLVAIRGDLKALSNNLNKLQMQVTNEGPDERLLGEGLLEALKSCRADCHSFEEKLTKWTKHSSERQVGLRDRIKVGFVKTGPIAAFRDRLVQSKSTLGLALDTLFLQQMHETQGNTDTTMTLVKQTTAAVEASQRDVDGKLQSVQDKIEALIHSLSAPSPDRSSAQDELEELQKESRLLQDCSSFDRHALASMNRMTVKMNISDVNIGQKAKLMTGLINVEDGNANIDAKIRGVTALDESRGMVGMGRNINTDSFWD